MKNNNWIENAGSNRKVHALLSVLTILIGVALLIYMVTVEDEPGAVPLLLIVVGSGWYLVTRNRFRSREK